MKDSTAKVLCVWLKQHGPALRGAIHKGLPGYPQPTLNSALNKLEALGYVERLPGKDLRSTQFKVKPDVDELSPELDDRYRAPDPNLTKASGVFSSMLGAFGVPSERLPPVTFSAFEALQVLVNISREQPTWRLPAIRQHAQDIGCEPASVDAAVQLWADYERVKVKR